MNIYKKLNICNFIMLTMYDPASKCHLTYRLNPIGSAAC
jgi:hypothetical protein